MSYHDLHITTAEIDRISIFDLPFDMKVVCTRSGGWELWQRDKCIAGEYGNVGNGLCLDVAGHIIVNSLP